MKTAVSLPDPIFEAAEELARRTGMSRSQLYALAIEAYVRAHRDDQVTEALDRLYANESSELDPTMAAIQAASLPAEEW